jgi:cytochrome P450
VEILRQDGNGELSVEDEESAIWTAYGVAADTTVVNLTALTLAMTKFPEAQRRAQEEIDRVVGADRENLPYVAAMVKETIRRWPISPMGFP